MSARRPTASSLWCLAQLKPNGLNLASRNLTRQGFEIFVPRHRITRRIGQQFKDVLAPLFPGYLFVEVNRAKSPWRRINSTLGVARLVSFSDRGPAGISCELIASLKARCDEDEVLGEVSQMSPGDQARIVNGPFAEFVAKVEKIDEARRVWMLLDIMGRETRVAIPASDVIAA